MSAQRLIRFLGFCPDLSPLTPGVFVDCSEVFPTTRGFIPLPTAQAQYTALPATCLGAFLAQYLDGSTRLFAGTATHLYEGSGGTWAEVDGGTTFTGGTAARWRFAMFGNDCIAVNGSDPPQVAGLTGNFSALSGSPLASCPIIASVYGFVFLFGSDNWNCSGIGNDTVWNNSVANQSATGALLDTPGPVTAGANLGRNVVAFKNRGVYQGVYSDIPLIWDFSCMSPNIGTQGQGCVVNIGNILAFVGLDDFYLFDGYSAYPVPGPNGGPNPVREWFFGTPEVPGVLDGTNAQYIEGVYDQINQTVTWYYPSVNASPLGTLDSYVAWNARTNKWTKGSIAISAVVRPYFQAQTAWSFNKFDNFYGTFNGIPNLPFNSPLFFGSSSVSQAYIDTNGVLFSLTGTPANSSITLGDVGDGTNSLYLDRLRPLFAAFPALSLGATMQATEYFRDNQGDTLSQGDTESLDPSGFINLRQSAAYHRWQLNFTGSYEIEGLSPDLMADGTL